MAEGINRISGSPLVTRRAASQRRYALCPHRHAERLIRVSPFVFHLAFKRKKTMGARKSCSLAGKVFGFLLALLEWGKFLAFMIESVFEIRVFFGKRDAFLSQESDHLYPYLSHGGGPFMFLSISGRSTPL